MSAFFDQANNTYGLADSLKECVSDVAPLASHRLTEGRNFEPGDWSCCKLLSGVCGV